MMHFISQLISDFGHLGLKDLGVLFAVILMDAALSGDNSIAINALAMDLPEKLRNKTVWIGMVLAAVLRLVALGFAAFIMTNPWVQILGGLYLVKLCVSYFLKKESDNESGHKTHSSFLRVLVAIGILDLSLSLDNIIAVVAMSQNMAVIFLGVLISIAMLAVATQVVRKVMGRYPSLEPAAYIILAFLGLAMVADHGSEFVIWSGEFMHTASVYIASAHDTIAKCQFKVGDVGEILGVASIVVTAIVIEEIGKGRKRALHRKMATTAHAKS